MDIITYALAKKSSLPTTNSTEDNAILQVVDGKPEWVPVTDASKEGM